MIRMHTGVQKTDPDQADKRISYHTLRGYEAEQKDRDGDGGKRRVEPVPREIQIRITDDKEKAGPEPEVAEPSGQFAQLAA